MVSLLGVSPQQLKAAARHTYGAKCAMTEFDNARTRWIRPEIRDDVLILRPGETLLELIEEQYAFAIADSTGEYFLDGTALYAELPRTHPPYPRHVSYCFAQSS